MAIKKSELYSSLWAGADSLRGGMDASEYKNYVLNLLFLKYISDKARNNIYSEIEVPEGCFYEDILALEGDKEIGDKLNKIIAKIAERNDLKGVIDSVDFNDNTKLGEGKAMIDTLSNLVKIFADLSLGAHGALDDDLLGDAYEYLMRHFASESGKSKGQFYTPSEVSLLLSLLLGIDENTKQDKSIYDPTCGSGSLLVKHPNAKAIGLPRLMLPIGKVWFSLCVPNHRDFTEFELQRIPYRSHTSYLQRRNFAHFLR